MLASSSLFKRGWEEREGEVPGCQISCGRCGEPGRLGGLQVCTRGGERRGGEGEKIEEGRVEEGGRGETGILFLK